jgi:hypothetical protein
MEEAGGAASGGSIGADGRAGADKAIVTPSLADVWIGAAGAGSFLATRAPALASATRPPATSSPRRFALLSPGATVALAAGGSEAVETLATDEGRTSGTTPSDCASDS